MEILRIDKYLSVALSQSRTDVKKLIKSGVITVNGETVKKSDIKVLDTDTVCISGKPLEYKKYVYLVLKDKKIVHECQKGDACRKTRILFPSW